MRAWLFLLLLAGCGLPSFPRDVIPPTWAGDITETSEAPNLQSLEERIHEAVNGARETEGYPALGWSADLATVAEAHSRDMAAWGYFDHDTPNGVSSQDRARASGVDCEVPIGRGRTRVGVSENLYKTTLYARIRTRGTGPTAERTVDWFSVDDLSARTVDGWMESPGHRRNLLDPVSTSHGIGIAVDQDDRLYVTQVLC